MAYCGVVIKEGLMPINKGHSFLVHPSKAAKTQPNIGGAEIGPHSGKLYGMLSRVFEDAHLECTIDIAFKPDSSGKQINDMHTQLMAYLKVPGIRTGRKVAEKLQTVTTNRSGLGLLFLLAGTDSKGSRLVIARFPADEGIVATESSKSLSLEFLERVFMKSAKSYKSVLYQSSSPTAGFWDGLAVDRQLNEGEISQYWIVDFLASQFRTSGAAGTRRVAIALKKAIRACEDTDIKTELWSAAKLIRGQAAAATTAAKVFKNLGLSSVAFDQITKAMPRADLMNETFKFDRAEFDSLIRYRSIELDNGALLVADNEHFEDVFHSEKAESGDLVRFTTQGRIVNQQTRKTP